MEKNIADQLNKAFEAFRQVSIEKEIAKKELEETTNYYVGYTRKLQKKIEDQQRLISALEAKLSALKQPPGEVKCDPCDHLHDGAGAFKKSQYQDLTLTGAVASNLSVSTSVDCHDMQDAFEAIQMKFRKIQSLTRRQKDHLKKFNGGNDTFNDQRFSMPIQCTDRTANAERPFSSTLRSPVVDVQQPTSSLASRGAEPEERDLDSLTKLSVKFPPPADSEYDFLNSAPERHIGLAVKPPRGSVSSPLPEEELPASFVYSSSPSLSASSSLSQESVRGPQQPLWSPGLCNAVAVGTDLVSPQSSSPDKCAFCHAVVPQEQMNMHLYSHFSHKNENDQ